MNHIEDVKFITKKGIFELDCKAFIDGREFKAAKPLTNQRVRLYNDHKLENFVCFLQHGSEVNIIGVHYNKKEKKYYFLISESGFEGWLPENYLSSNKEIPIGALV